MDSDPVRPARRWPLLPSRKAGEPSTVPVTPTANVNPAVASAPTGAADSRRDGRAGKKRADDQVEDSPDETDRPDEQHIDRQV